MIVQKDVKDVAPASLEKPVGEIRVVKDQREVRALLGDTTMNAQIELAFSIISSCRSRGAFVFLSFTEEGKGKVWLSDCDEVSGADDSPDATIMRQKLASIVGEERANHIWVNAKKIKGWSD